MIQFVQNAFSVRLSGFGFNLFSIFLVDFMHEFELGVWKKTFVHILRILECVDGAINESDRRYNHCFLNRYWSHCIISKISTCANLWPWFNPEIYGSCFPVKEIRCTRLRKYSPGNRRRLSLAFPELIHFISAVFRFWKTSCLPRTTAGFWLFCSLLHIGTPWQNFDNTRIYRLIFWVTSQLNWGNH